MTTTKENEFSGNFNWGVSKSAIKRAKKRLKKHNDKYRGGKPESMFEAGESMAELSHHIFPVNEFDSIKACKENLIRLTEHQHKDFAHYPDMSRVDEKIQKIFILDKIDRIEENLKSDQENIYSFEKLKEVLNIGLGLKEDFSKIEENDFDAIRKVIYTELLSGYSDELTTQMVSQITGCEETNIDGKFFRKNNVNNIRKIDLVEFLCSTDFRTIPSKSPWYIRLAKNSCLRTADGEGGAE